MQPKQIRAQKLAYALLKRHSVFGGLKRHGDLSVSNPQHLTIRNSRQAWANTQVTPVLKSLLAEIAHAKGGHKSLKVHITEDAHASDSGHTME